MMPPRRATQVYGSTTFGQHSELLEVTKEEAMSARRNQGLLMMRNRQN